MLIRHVLRKHVLSTAPAPQPPLSPPPPAEMSLLRRFSPLAGFAGLCSGSRLGRLFRRRLSGLEHRPPINAAWTFSWPRVNFCFCGELENPGVQNSPARSSFLAFSSPGPWWCGCLFTCLLVREGIFHMGDLLPAFSGTEEGVSVLAPFPR